MYLVTTKKTLFLIIFLLVSLAASLVLVLRTTVFIGKAATGNTSPVTLENSYLFASPLQAKADGNEQIRLIVFLLDGRGVGVVNQNVELVINQAIKTKIQQSTTDDSGKAVFDLSSVSTGQYEVAAKTARGTLPQKVKITFY